MARNAPLLLHCGVSRAVQGVLRAAVIEYVKHMFNSLKIGEGTPTASMW